jgi:hypothetical protein
MVHPEVSHLQARTPIAICHTRRKNPLIRLARVFVFVLAWLHWFTATFDEYALLSDEA